MVDVRQRIESHGGQSEKAFDEIYAEMAAHMAAGGKTSFWLDDKQIPISRLEGGKAFDAKNQQWGMLSLAMGLPGTRNGIEFHGIPAPTPAGSVPSDKSIGGSGNDVLFNGLMNKQEYSNLLLETANGTRLQAHPNPFTRAPGIGTDIGLRDGSRIEQDLVHRILDGVTHQVLWERAKRDIDRNEPTGKFTTSDPVGGKASEWAKAWATEADALKEATKARKSADDALKGKEPAGKLPTETKPAGLTSDARKDKPGDGLAGRGSGGGGKGGSSPDANNVSAFDRPVATIILGPNPLPVEVVRGGKAGSGGRGDEKTKEDKGTWEKAGGMLGRGIANTAAGTGRFVSSVVENDYAGASSQLLDGVSKAGKALEELGPAGAAAGVALQTVAGAAKAYSEVVGAFIQRGRELASLDGGLAGATAMADVRSLMSDLREAEVLGPKMAELIEQQSRMESALREGLLPIKEFILDEVLGFMTNIGQFAVWILEALNKLLNYFGKDINETITKIKELLEGKNDEAEAWTRDWERAMNSFRPRRDLTLGNIFPGVRPADVPLGVPVLP